MRLAARASNVVEVEDWSRSCSAVRSRARVRRVDGREEGEEAVGASALVGWMLVRMVRKLEKSVVD